MKGLPFGLSLSLVSGRAGAHLTPPIWRPKLAYDTGTIGFGRTTQGCNRHAR